MEEWERFGRINNEATCNQKDIVYASCSRAATKLGRVVFVSIEFFPLQVVRFSFLIFF